MPCENTTTGQPREVCGSSRGALWHTGMVSFRPRTFMPTLNAEKNEDGENAFLTASSIRNSELFTQVGQFQDMDCKSNVWL